MHYLLLVLLSFFASSLVHGGFPLEPQGITTQQLSNHPGVSISYKRTYICETQAQAWAGYVNMPSSYLEDIESAAPYNLSMFFWYFEARNNPESAPTTMYLAGGPGDPSSASAVQDSGPCVVLRDANSTANNPWSMTTNVNMLYIDQPVSTGYSYTTLVNSTLNQLFLGSSTPEETGITPFSAYNGYVPAENTTFVYGTFSEQNPQKTANGTLNAAKTLWHFSQAWFTSFPGYCTSNKQLNLFGNSYGGYWVPITAQYIVEQNAAIKAGKLSGTVIPVDTVGWTNGCVDELVQGEWYPQQAYNNTYGLQVIPKPVYLEATNNFTKSGGCADLIDDCRALGNKLDPDNLNMNPKVNKVCVEALEYCFAYVTGAYTALSNRSVFDMAHLDPDPFPTSYPSGYFNRAWVQKALGVPANYSSYSYLVNNIFLYETGDAVRVNGLQSVEFLLAQGVRVNMIYGDRDYRCPWNGAEKLSLALKWSGAEAFAKAGYSYVQTNSSYQGGMVRQHGNLSFTRVFEAGHDAYAYQPETVFQLYNRFIFSKDVATGLQTVGSNYSTSGPSSSFGVKDHLPPPPPFNCNLYNVAGSCTIQQYEALEKGTAEVVNFNVVKPKGGSPGSIANV